MENQKLTITSDGDMGLKPGESAIVFSEERGLQLFLRKPDGNDNPKVPHSMLMATSVMILLQESEEFQDIVTKDVAERWTDEATDPAQ